MTEEIKEIERYLKKCSNCFTCNNFLGEDEKGGHCMLQNAYNYITNLQKDIDNLDDFNRHLLNKNKKLQKENENLKNVMFTGRNYNEVLKSEQDYKSRNEKAVEYNYKLQEKTSHQALFDEPLASEIYSIAENNINILQGGDE